MFEKRIYIIRANIPNSNVLYKMETSLFNRGHTSVTVDINRLCLKIAICSRSRLLVKLLCKLFEIWAKQLLKEEERNGKSGN